MWLLRSGARSPEQANGERCLNLGKIWVRGSGKYVATIARLGLERAEEQPACVVWGCSLLETRRAATSYTKRDICIKQISQLADLNSITIDALSCYLYPQPRHTFPPPSAGSFQAAKFATQSKSPLIS